MTGRAMFTRLYISAFIRNRDGAKNAENATKVVRCRSTL